MRENEESAPVTGQAPADGSTSDDGVTAENVGETDRRPDETDEATAPQSKAREAGTSER